MNEDTIYVVTDAEFDGPVPGVNSMLSFASVAVDALGNQVDTFEAVLAPLADAEQDPGTMAWFASQPGALAAATDNPKPAADVIHQFVTWVRALPGTPLFTSHPLALDGIWMDFYLRRFTGDRTISMPRDTSALFSHSGLCLRSFAAGRLNWPLEQCRIENYPAEWLGGVEHTHRAIDDARGYAHLLAWLLNASCQGQPPIQQAAP